MREVTKNAKYNQLNSKDSKGLKDINRNKKRVKERLEAGIQIANKSNQIDFANRSKQLFLQWKSELERYTDIHPVYFNAPPLTTTKVKAFTFRSATRDRNSPVKEVILNKSENIRAGSRQSENRKERKLKLSKFYNEYNNKIKRAKTPNKLKARKTFTRNSKRRPKTRGDNVSNFENIDIYQRHRRPIENKLKINFNKIVMDSIMNRPVSRESAKSVTQNIKNKNAKFNNVFIF